MIKIKINVFDEDMDMEAIRLRVKVDGITRSKEERLVEYLYGHEIKMSRKECKNLGKNDLNKVTSNM